MEILLILLLAGLVAVVVNVLFGLFAPQYSTAAAVIAFLVVILIKLGGL